MLTEGKSGTGEKDPETCFQKDGNETVLVNFPLIDSMPKQFEFTLMTTNYNYRNERYQIDTQK